MNNIFSRSLCVSLLAITLTIQPLFASFHKQVGDASKAPSNVCAQFIETPLKNTAKSLAPKVPDNIYPEITLPLLSCILYTISKQIIPEVQETKHIKSNQHVKAAINAFSMSLITAGFHDTWEKDPFSTDWFLRNSINILLLVSNARSIYKTYAPQAQKA